MWNTCMTFAVITACIQSPLDVKPVVNWIEGTHTLGAFEKSSVIGLAMLIWHLLSSLHAYRVHWMQSLSWWNTYIGCILKVQCYQSTKMLYISRFMSMVQQYCTLKIIILTVQELQMLCLYHVRCVAMLPMPCLIRFWLISQLILHGFCSNLDS